MACTLTVDDPSFPEILERNGGVFENALKEFLTLYDSLKAPENTDVDSRYRGSVVFSRSFVPKKLPTGLVNGNELSIERIKELANRGFTIVGTSPQIEGLRKHTVNSINNVLLTEKTIVPVFSKPIDTIQEVERDFLSTLEQSISKMYDEASSDVNKIFGIGKREQSENEFTNIKLDTPYTFDEVADRLQGLQTHQTVDTFLAFIKTEGFKVVFTNSIKSVGKYKNGIIYINPKILARNSSNIIEKELYSQSELFNGSTNDPLGAATKMILAHELAHGITVNKIRIFLGLEEGKISKEEREILKKLTKFYEKNKKFFPEEVSDIYEFVSRAMTSPSFAHFLDTFNHTNEQTLWDRLVEFISSLFSSNQDINFLVKEFLNLNKNTNAETLHETEAEYDYKDTTFNALQLIRERQNNVGRLSHRIKDLKSKKLAITQNPDMKSNEKIIEHVKIDSQLYRLSSLLELEKNKLRALNALTDFHEYEQNLVGDFYFSDVTSVKSALTRAENLLRNLTGTITQENIEELQNSLQDLTDASYIIEQWRAYADVDSTKSRESHIFVPTVYLNGLSEGRRLDLYSKFFQSYADISTSRVFVGKEDNMSSLKEKHSELLKKTVQTMVNSDAYLKALKFPTQGGQIINDNTFLDTVLDIDQMSSLIGMKGSSMFSEESVLAKVLVAKMGEVDAVAMEDFKNVTSKLDELYDEATKEASKNGLNINELFFQSLYLLSEPNKKRYTSNLTTQFTEFWSIQKDSVDADYESTKRDISKRQADGIITAKAARDQYSANYRRHNIDFQKIAEVLNLNVLPEIVDYVTQKSLESRFSTVNALTLRNFISSKIGVPDQKYRQSLIDEYGQELYDKAIKEQKENIDRFFYSTLTAISEIVSNQTEFKAKHYIDDKITSEDEIIQIYVLSSSPFHNYDNFKGKKPVFNGDSLSKVKSRNYEEGKALITYLPRKTYADVFEVTNPHTGAPEIVVNKGTKNTGFYDANYLTIEKHPNIKKYYDKVMEVLELANSRSPGRAPLPGNSLPLNDRTFMEYILKGDGSDNTGLKYLFSARVRPAMLKLWRDIFNSFSSSEFTESGLKTAKEIKSGDIRRVSLSSVKDKQKEIQRVFNLLQEEAKANKVNLIPSKVIDLYYQATDIVTREHSMDLHKMVQYYAKFMVLITHKQNSLPLLDSIFEIFKTIKSPATRKGVRGFFTPIRDESNTSATEDRIKSISKVERMFNIWKLHPKQAMEGVMGKGFVESGKKDILNRIEAAIPNVKSPEIKELLEDWANSLRRKYVFSKLIDSILINALRLKGLAVAPVSAIRNRNQGFTANAEEAAKGVNFDMRSFRRASSALLNTVFGRRKYGVFGEKKNPTAIKISNLVRRFDFLQDMTDEIEKAATRGGWYSMSATSLLLILQKKIEFLNQAEVMLSMLMFEKIKHNDGSTWALYDALDSKGNLKDEFKNSGFSWTSPEGKALIVKIKSVRDITQGDYTPEGSGMAKTTWIGRLATLFQTWMGAFVFKRFADEQFVPGLGPIKGVDRSTSLGHKLAVESHSAFKALANPYSAGVALYSSLFGIDNALDSIVSYSAILLPMIYSVAHLMQTFILHGMTKEQGEDFLSLKDAKDFYRMQKAIGQRVLRHLYLYSTDTVQNQFSAENLPDVDKQNLRAAAERAALVSLLSLASTITILLALDDDEKERDNPIFNLITNLLDSAAADINWASTFWSYGYSGNLLESASNQGGFVVSNAANFALLIQGLIEGGSSGEWKNAKKGFGKIVTPSGYNQIYGAYEAYQFGVGARYPYEKPTSQNILDKTLVKQKRDLMKEFGLDNVNEDGNEQYKKVKGTDKEE
ncbi:MAG TPA: hypothetical protein PKD00_00470 [Burkholderiales bacterium]|nr:hypothetical protein [Burkholderiales bacterium]